MTKKRYFKKTTPFIFAGLIAISLAGCGITPTNPLEEGKAAFEENRFRDAQIYMQEALKEHANNPEAQLLYGEVLIGRGDYLGAQTALAKVTNGSQVHNRARLLSAKAMAMGGKSEDALKLIAEYEGSDLTKEEKSLLAWSESFALLNLEREDEAVKIMDAAIQADPDNAELLTLKAKYFFEAKDYARAEGLLALSFKKDPELYESLLLSGRLNMVKNDLDKAAQQFEQAKTLYPDARAPLMALANISLNAGDYDQSRTYVDAMLSMSGKDPQGLLMLAQLELADGNEDKTLEILQNLDKVSTNLPTALLLKGQIALKRQNYEMAEESLTKFLSASPNDERGLVTLAKTYEATDRMDEALRAIEPVIRNANAKADALAYAAKLTEANGDARANNLALRSNVAGKADIKPAMLKAEEAIKAGNWAGAETVYKKLRSNGHGQNPLVLNNSAMVALKSGKIDDAEAFARAAYNIASQDPQIMDTLGYILLARGNEKQEALKLIKKASKILPAHRGIQVHLAEAYRANGDINAAKRIEKKIRG